MPDLIDLAAIDDSTALVFGERRVPRREFAARVAVLARELIDRGVGPDVPVAVVMPRSVELLVALHAIIAAGGAYVPVDPEAPAERAAYMVSTAGATLVLVRAGELPPAIRGLGEGVQFEEVDADGAVDLDVALVTDADRNGPLRPEHAAYTLFTSGSTGQPKGVTVSHRAIANRLAWMRDWYAIGASDVFVQKTPATFDVSVWELFLPAVVGATLVIAEPDRHGEPDYLADLIQRERVTVVHFVPSMLAAFTDVLGAELGALRSLRLVFTSGEALTAPVARRLIDVLPGAALHNLYGPTEAAVDVTAHHVVASDSTIPIGVPVPRTSAYVLDSRLQWVPAGVPGELYLGGVQLARAYADRPDLTAERFVADPFAAPGDRLYRTGDLVRWSSGGELEYLGRTDFQVKLRGQRMELGEVEAVILSAPGVVNAAAAVVDFPAGAQLVGYVAPESVDPAALDAAMAAKLPEYMRPSRWVTLPELPLNAAGKVARRQLPRPEAPALEYVAPESEAEQLVADVFAGILGVDRVSVSESFFDLGGNSLAATRVAARVSDVLGVAVSVRDVFDAATVRALVVAVAGRRPALAPVVPVVPRPERIPLSFAQHRMWFINQLEPELPTYNIPAVLRLTGELDLGALRAALADVVERHEVLRTTFPSVDGEPYQSVSPAAEVATRLDWAELDDPTEFEAAMRRGFHVGVQWPLRARVLRVNDREALFGIVAHHIGYDGQSFGPLVADFVTAFAARARGEVPVFLPLPVQFADFALWQHRVLGDPADTESVLGRQLNFWRQHLAGVPDVLELPTDHVRPPVASHAGDVVRFAIPGEVSQRVDAYAAGHGVTRFMVLHAVFALLLARLAATDDVVLGTPIAGRGQRQLDGLVGMFANTLVLRTRIDPAASFEALLATVRDTDLTAFEHSDVPFESIVDALNPVRSEAFSPLVQVILSVDPLSASDTVSVGGLDVSPVDITEIPAQLDLDLTLLTDAEEWIGKLTFATDLFERSRIERMGEQFVRVLGAALAAPTTAVGDLPLLAAGDRAALVRESVGPVRPLLDETIADAVAASAALVPDAVALVTGGREISYAEFGCRVGDLARRLIAAGVASDDAVGLVMDRSAELVIAVHAILAAGGQYVPIAVDSPVDRATYAAATAGVRLVLVRAGAELPEFVSELAVSVIEVDASGDLPVGARPLDPAERQRPLRSSDAAYTLFTSGSTGLPKGVTVSHRAVRNFVGWFGRLVPEGDQRLLFKTPHTFDASVLELFWPLVAGQTMVIADAQGHRDPRYLATVMNDAGVSVVQFVPSLLAAFLDVVGDEPLLPGLRVLFSGGEALPPAVAVNFRERAPQARLVNLFGPTEAAVYTVAAELATPGDVVPIGAPMTNTTAFVLDDRLHPVPDGVVGELYLGGVQSARGYAARPDLTAERFVADPFGAPGDRLYRTGDLVRRGHSAELEYLGRTDFQVKIRGQRLELGEVEAAIVAGPGVVHAAVRVVAGAVGDQLVGYVAPASVDVDALGADLARRLPDYMVPTMWVPLAEMPLNSAGKVDRRALPDPVFEAAEFVAPDTPDEAAVAAVYADLLGVERVSVTESFFDLGGNSLGAMRLVARVSDALGVQVSVRDVFDAPSVRELVTAVADRAEALPPVVRVDPRPERVPLSFAQQRMWFLNRFDSSLPTYNIPVVLRITGVLDVAALRVAVADVVERHEVLRTTFPEFEGEPVQSIADRAMVGVSLPWWEVDSEERLVAEVTRGFDVTVEWPIRAIVHRIGADEWLFGVVAHHIATDGESMLPLVADVMGAYAARRSGAVPGFEPLPVQFADFAIWQRAVLGSPEAPDSVIGRQLEYWRACLADLPDVLELPADRKRPAVASYRGAEVPFEVPEAVARRVAAVGGAHGVTPFMVVHAALAVLLARLSATDDIAIVTPVAGRGQAELDRLVGMFVNTLVLRTRVGPSMSFADLLRQVRQVDLDAFAHADVPFEAVVDALDPVRSEAFAPLAQVMLSFDPSASARGVDAAVEGLRIEALPDPVVPAQVDLTFRVMSDPAGGWSGTLVFATDLFDPATARWFAERFVAVLDELTADPGGAVGDAVVLDARDRERADAAAVGPVVPVPAMTLADAVAAAAARTPDAVAVVFEGREVSYAEFGARVAVLARELIGFGVGPDVAVGVCIDRSVELLVAIHAVVAAGGRYVPLDVDVPAERARVMLETAGAEITLVAAGQVSGASEVLAGQRCVEVDAAGHVDVTVAPVTDGDRSMPLRSDHAVYTLFTSGSTGVPKGVTVSHAAVMNRLAWMRDDYSIDHEDRFVLKTPYTFDVSVWELFLPFLVGARLIVTRPDGHRDPQYLAAEIARESVSVVHFVPSMLAVFLDVLGEGVGDLGSLSRVFTSGEALPAALAQDVLAALPLAELHNLYGPTEAAVDVTAERVLPGAELVTIGLPVANTRAVVLDARLHPVPDGVPGELYLGGVQLARGYASRADLTAERFVADPQGVPGSRLYRTGDLVRRLGDGSLDYLGRTDFQVKLRGQRIELSEIESVIASAPGVVHVAATVAQAPAGGEFLVAYVSPSSVDLAALRDHAATALPEYMRPSVWTLLDEVALNSAGKLDRRALPAPDFGTADHEYTMPVGPVEEQLAAIVAGLLGLDRVSVTESFFALGGDSIMSIRLASAARAAGWELSPREIFENRTVRKMAALVTGAGRGVPPLAELPGGGVGPSAIRPIVSWMLEHSDAPSDFADFAQSMVLVGPDGMTTEALGDVLSAMAAAHPMLTARLVSVDGEWSLVAGGDFDAAGAVIEVRSAHGVATAEFGAAVRAAYAEAVSGMNPATGDLLRAALVIAGDGRSRIVLAVHHLGVDAVSWPIMIEDLVTGWAQRASGAPYSLRPEGTSQRTWAAGVDELRAGFETQTGYWLDRLPARPTDLGDDLDRARDRDRTSDEYVHYVASEVAAAALTRVPEAFGGSVDDVLLGTFARAVRGWQRSRGSADTAPVSVLVEGHGRDEHLLERGAHPRRGDLSRTVGWFTTIAPLRLDPASDVVHAIKAAKEERLGIPDGGAGFGALRYRGDGQRSATELGSRPLPSILFNYLGSAGAALTDAEAPFGPAAQAPPLPGSVTGAMAMPAGLVVDATGIVDEHDGGRRLRMRFRFPAALLNPADVADLADRWTAELDAAVAEAAGPVGFSPSDVPGSGITQDELDRIALESPGAQVWPLTPLQTGLFYQSGLLRGGEMDAYHIQACVRFGGAVDADRLRTAVDALPAHHEVLRSGFRQIDAGVVAVVPAAVSVPLRVVDLGHLDEAVAGEQIAEIADAERAERFDLASPPLMRAVLVRHGGGADLVVTSHHILFDGWSGPLVLADLLAVYATGTPYTPIHERSFADHVRAIARTDASAGIEVWRDILAPVDGPTLVAPAGVTHGDSLPEDFRFTIDADAVAALHDLARHAGVTLATVLQALWGVILSRVTGKQVVVFGETVSGRPADLDGVDTMVGLFINTLPVVVDVDPSVTFAELLARVQATKVRLLDQQHVGLAALGEIEPAALAFDTLAVHESYPIDTESITSVRTDGLDLLDVTTRDATHYPLTFVTEEHGGEIGANLKYLAEVFDRSQIAVFAEAVDALIRGVVAAPDSVVADLSLLGKSERDRLAALPAPSVPASAERSLVELFTASAAGQASAPAVTAGGRTASYAELDDASDAVAAGLRAAGVRPGDLVGVATARSVNLVATIVGVLKAGAAYLPLDTTNPVERLAYIVADAGAAVVLTDASTAGHDLWSRVGEEVRVLDVDELIARGAGDGFVPVAVPPASRAYVIYTSGSTGLPKGVEVTHADVGALMGAASNDFDFRSGDVWTMFHSYAFDFSVWELWGPLLSGARLVVVDRDLARDLDAFVRLLADERVTVLNLTPSAFYQLIEARRRNRGADLALRYVVFGGEELAFDQVRRWFDENPGDAAQLVNMYGITETTVHVSFRPIERAEVSAADPSFIGRPLSSLAIHILDDRLRPVPAGVVGEMYVAGAQLAQGYLARPGLSATRFVANPFGLGGAGSRLYRTGDRARWVGADIEYLGRADGQVQLRGFRIEYGEVEAALLAADGVVGAAAAVVSDSARGDLLIGYVVADDGVTVDPAAVREWAGSRVPRYMVPDLVVVLGALPLTANGKLDRGALPAPVFDGGGEYAAPASAAEEAVAAVFAKVLGVERVSVTESFFDSGGNSLSAMRVVARAGEALGVELSIRDLFEAPTVRGLVAASADRAAALPPVTAVVPRPSEIPLSFAQQRMWLVNQADPASGAYNIPMGLRITGPLDLDALHAAMVDVVLRHEVLRTTFPSVEGQPRQRIARDSSVAARMDWDVVESFEEIQDALTSGFNLTRQAPVRIRVFAAGPDEHIVVVVVHHIAFDGESMAPFVTDLVTAYLAEADDRDPEFAALPFGFADYAIWQHEVLGRPDDPASVVGGQLEYWRSQLAGLPELVELPLDRPRPAVASQRGAVVPFVIAAETARKITLLADRSGSTPFMIVHAALAALVARMTGQRDIAIGSPIAGRGQVGLDGLVGMFVNTLVLRTEVRRGMTFEELVAEAKRVDLAAYDNADVPFDTVVDELAVAQSPAFSPFTQVWLTFNQTDVPELAGEKLTGTEIGGLTIEPLAQTEHPAKVDLLVAVEQSDDDWSGGLVYAADLFDERSMIVFAAYLVAVVEQAVADPALAVTSLALPEHVVAEESVPATPAAPGALPVRTARPIPAGGAIVSGGDGTDPVLLSEIFAHAADRWGPRQAVVDPDGSYLTYADLDARSNRLARWLIGHGVGSEQLVALAMERSSQLLVAIWAVAKTGAGYVPIDPTYPADRVIAMVEDSGAMIGLTAGAPGELPAGDFSWYRLDDRELNATVDGLDAAPLAEAERVRPVYVDNTAYVIFTSGSTGRPKGVAVTHSGLANFAAEEVRLAEADERARVLGFASPSFDASVLEYLLAARSGGVLVYRPSGAVGGQVLQDFIMRQAVTHTFLTPSVLATMDPAMLPSLRVVYAGGEAVPQALKDRWAMFPRIQNLYGPTETTIGVAISAPMQIGAPVYLGGPLAGVGFLVLDDELQPVPVGVPGELYVCGDQLSRGYLGVPVLTASRFVANPFGIAGDRMYRTGDVVRWRQSDDGRRVIEYTGRSDDQIKLRGLRIELGEIETVLAGHADVTTAVVVGVGGSVATALAAYVTPRTGAVVNSAQLRAYLADRLPSHMVPAAVTVLDEMPLTPVGKLDKNALPEPVIDHAEYVSPEDGAETVIAEVFAEILGMDQVSATASFFDLGGNSLSAMRVVGRVGEALDVEISIADVFAAPTVRQLALALGGRGHALPAVTIVTPRPEPVPLSFAQRRMWFINRLDPSAPTYNIPGAVRLRGSLDRVALKQAMADVVARHEVLRTVFPDREGVPAQVVIDADDVDSALDWDVAESVADVADVLAQGFDVTTELPLRVRLLSESDDSAILAFVFHHIAFDGQSFGPMLADLLTAYAARAAGGVPEFAELPVQYADYALWQRDVLGSPDQEESILGQQLAFWTDTLAGAPEVIDLPTDRPRPPVFSPDGGQVGFAIPAELGARVDEFAAQAGATRFMVLHAAFAVLLSRLSGSDDVVLGTPFDGRGPRGLGALVGMFVNTVVLRSRVRPGESFESLTAATRDADLAAFAHADMPFESVVDAVDPVRSEAFSPLVQVILSVDPVAEAPDEVAVAGVVVEPYGDYQIPAQMDLNLTVSAGEESGDWSAVLTYPTALFDRSSVVTLGDRFVGVLEGLLTDPEAPVGDLVLLADTESAEILAESTGPEVPWLEETIADAVAARVAAAPSAIALVAGARELSYGEFGARVGELARRLIAAGVGPESAVGLVMDRSVELVVAVHAVLAAGGQYVPIAVDSPADRAVFVASTAGVGTVLVAAGAQVPDFVSSMAVPVLEVDCSNELAAGTEPLSAAERSGVLRSPDAAYTLFTSGSTGLPKGVTVSHGAVRNFVAWFDETVPAGAQRLLFKTPHTFDASVLELFWPLVAGQTMVIADAGGERDPRYLAEVINDAEVSVAQFVPSLLSAFLDVVDDAELLPGLRVLFSGGEALPPAVARDFRRRVPHAKLVNLFGPTEAAVYSMSAVLDVVGETVPIGAPMANTTALILDNRLQLVPVGVAGELYLGGVQSARGYAERPDLTAERFVADPFGDPGARLYRTGDLARRTSSGALEYLGRTDFQVKLRGQRLELGEVESAIAAAEGVVHAAARVVGGPAGDQLVGYVAPASVDTGAVAGELARRLPGYMVPTVWVALDEMPLNTAGKVDRRALPEPEFEAVEYMAPATAAEESVAAVFADLLGVERVSVTASFFDAGGNSLAAMRLVARVADVLGVQVSVRDVFDAPSVRELVAVAAGRAPALPPVTAVQVRPERIPLSRAQRRMWYLNQVDPSSPTYNIPMAVHLTGEVDTDALVEAVHDALDRHEVLRTVYPSDGADPYQVIVPAAEARERFDWARVDSLDELTAVAATGFDVSSELPIRGRVRRTGDGVDLAIVAHHIAFDGESTPVLLRDVLAAYARRIGLPSAPARTELAVQYADYALWERDVLGNGSDPESPLGREMSYWRDKLHGLPTVTDLPMDRPRPAVFDSRGDLVTVAFDEEFADRIDELCRRYRVTPFMVTYAALVVMIARLAATSDAVVAAPTAGRTGAAVDEMVGMFVNTLILRADVAPGRTVDELLRAVRSDVVDAFSNADVQFDELVEALAPPRSTSYAPLAQIAFTYAEQQKAEGPVVVGDIQAEPLSISGHEAKFDLMVVVQGPTSHSPLSVRFLYSTALYDSGTVEGFAEVYRRILTALVDDQHTAIGDIDIIGPRATPTDELAAQASGGGGFSEAGTLVALLAERAVDEDHPALIFDGAEIDYAEFEGTTNRIARALLARGLAPDDVVAIGMPRSVESVLAMWGVFKAGAACVVVDPADEHGRLAGLLADAAPKATITREGEALPIVDGDTLDFAALVDAGSSAAPIDDSERNGPIRLTNLAYLTYPCSGASEQRTVALSHAGMAALVAGFGKLTGSLEDDPDTRILHSAQSGSARAFFETAWAITMGHTLVIAEPGAETGDRLGAVLLGEEVTDLLVTPSALSEVDPACGAYVRTLAVTGAPCPEDLAGAWTERGRRLFNLYGAAEVTLWATRARIMPRKAATAGRPLDGVTVRVLDRRLQPAPDGETGDLYLAADGLARGYLGGPAETGTRFVPDPLGAPGARMYRTGERAKLVKGELEID
ncbi:non-ribosomal peptide synthase/polyketide synthase [Gordonia iterans]